MCLGVRGRYAPARVAVARRKAVGPKPRIRPENGLAVLDAELLGERKQAQ